ncbi:MAG: ABC transporter permease [Acidobacteriota bacterium]|nr:ABC transporter permease [Acidobacteriota bacterium]
MNAVWATITRELRAYFLSPLAYIVAALLLLVNGFVFWFIVSALNNPQFGGQIAPLGFFFNGLFFWLVLLFVAPALAMRLISEERRSGTIEMLLTAPITEAQVVVSKFLSAWIFYAFLWLPTVTYALILEYYHEVDWGPVAASYLGVLTVGALFLSVGVLATALTRSQLVAAAITFALLIPLFSFGFLEGLVNAELPKQIFSYLSLPQHMEDFSRGIVETRHLAYHLSATVFFLFLASRALAARKWR